MFIVRPLNIVLVEGVAGGFVAYDIVATETMEHTVRSEKEEGEKGDVVKRRGGR